MIWLLLYCVIRISTLFVQLAIILLLMKFLCEGKQKMSKENNVITLVVGGAELKFAPTTAGYNKYINELMPDNKVAPSHNYLRRVVTPECKEMLDALLEKPGVALQLAAKVNEQFVPELEIEVKN